MLLGGFSLELLVDGKLLKEYSESVDKRTTTTGVSYILDQKTGEKIESDQTYYAAVDLLDKNYEILFGAKKELFTMGEQTSAISFRTKIYIDGQLDRSLRLINKPVKMKKDGFIGEKRKKTALMFDLSKWMENDDESIEKSEPQKRDDSEEDAKNDNDDNLKPDQNKFGYGAVSVYFFNAKDFDKNETATGNPIPLAALHLHYRPTQWLLARDILAKEESIEIFDETQIIKEVDDTVQQNVQQVKPPAHPEGNKNMNEEPDDDDCDISEWTGKLILDDEQEVVEENQGTKKKTRGRKKNVEKIKNVMEEPADNDCDKEKLNMNNVQEVVEENRGAKKKSRGKKEKNVGESDDNDCDTRKSTLNDAQEVIEENQEAKKKTRGRKKNVEKVKNEMEEPADNDCDKEKLNLNDVQEVVEENQGAKKKTRGRKKNVEKVNEESEKSGDDDCNISELTEKLTLDDTRQTVEKKKKSRDKKDKNVENVTVSRYNLRPRK